MKSAKGMSAEGENSRSEVDGAARQPGPQGLPKASSQTPDQIAAGLSEGEKRDLLALRHASYNSLSGGVFDGFSADRGARFAKLKLARFHMPAGCQAVLAKITPHGLAVCALISKETDNG